MKPFAILLSSAALAATAALTCALPVTAQAESAEHGMHGAMPHAAGGVVFHDPWVREGPPTVQVLAGYFTIENASDRMREIVSVASPAFERVEIHETVLSNGMMQMLPHESLPLPPKSWVVFEPGGYHLMLIGRQQRIASGDHVMLMVTFKDGSTQEVHAVVRRGGMSHGGGGMEGMGGMDHSSHR